MDCWCCVWVFQYFPGSDEPLKLPHQSSPNRSGSSSATSTGDYGSSSIGPAQLRLETGRKCFFMNDCVPPPGSYAESSNRSDDNTERRNSVGREETLKSFEAKFPLQFKPSKVKGGREE